jgi:DNA polymerase-3 subunit alpha
MGEHIAVPRSLAGAGSVEWPEHEVIALGHLLAECNLCHPSGLYCYNQDESSIADFIAAAECFPNVRCTRSEQRGTASIYTARAERLAPNGIMAWAKQLDLLGRTATAKSVPAEAFALTDTQLALLLGRLWDGDGHVNANDRSAFYATSSKELAQQVRHLLCRLGIIARVRTVHFPYGADGRTGYQVFVTGADNLQPFARLIGPHLVAAAKRRAMEALTATVTHGASKDLVPVEPVRALARAAKARAGLTWQQIEDGADVSSRDLYPARTNPAKGGFTRPTVRRLARYFNDPALTRLADSDVLWFDRLTNRCRSSREICRYYIEKLLIKIYPVKAATLSPPRQILNGDTVTLIPVQKILFLLNLL